MVTPVEVALLGPVEVRIDGRAVAVPGASLRLLAILATQPGRVCSLASIVDGLWGEAATERAEGFIRLRIPATATPGPHQIALYGMVVGGRGGPVCGELPERLARLGTAEISIV